MTLRHACGAGNCFKDRYLPDWGILDGCFPRGIKPSDIDGVVELNSHFLWLEWKSEAKSVPGGQLKMLTRLTQDAPMHTVIIIFGRKWAPEKIQIIREGKTGKLRTCDGEALRKICARWAAWTEGPKLESVA